MFGAWVNFWCRATGVYEAIDYADQRRVERQFRSNRTPYKQLSRSQKQARQLSDDIAETKDFLSKLK